MKQIESVEELKNALSASRRENVSVGFVPTMGALHEGHLSLVRQSCDDNDVTVVSIFLNPTQFNNRDDFEKYPKNLSNDLKLLEAEGVDFVFTPTVEEIYPEALVEDNYHLGRVAEVMEGQYRPGHFRGVAQVVARLFKIVEPDRAYFGEKDFQQIAVIKKLMTQLPQLSTQIISCPVIREQSGLAMSSRNMRLSEHERELAAEIYQGLKLGLKMYREGACVQQVHDAVLAYIEKNDLLRVEYLSIVDAYTLEAIDDWRESTKPVACITVYCNKVRLIDHIHFTK